MTSFFLAKLFVFALVSTLILSSAFIVIIKQKLESSKFLQRQLSWRDQHQDSILRLGGVGIALSFLLMVLILMNLDLTQTLSASWKKESLVLLLGGLATFSLGLTDDLRNLPARYKLLGQFVIALLPVLFGLRIEKVLLPFYVNGIDLGIFGIPLTLFWVVGMMNAFNLIDGLDGLSGGIAGIALGVLTYLSLMQGKYFLALLCIALIGAVLGFLVFNKPPASIFMGDSGSLFLGYMLANLSIWAVQNPENTQINLVPLLILAIPLLDTTFSIFRRYLKGIPFYSADRDHLHHRLIAKGYSATQSMQILCGMTLIFGIMGIGVYHFIQYHTFIYLGAILLAYLLLFFLEYDLIQQPVESFRGQSSLKQRRQFLSVLSLNIDLFFEKDRTLEELIRSFQFWSSLVGIETWVLQSKGTTLHQQGVFSGKSESSNEESKPNALSKHLFFQQGTVELRMLLTQEDLRLDSDFKGSLADQVIASFLKRTLAFLEKNNS